MKDFITHVESGGTFNLLGCLTRNNFDSYPSPYLQINDEFLLDKPYTLGDNIELNFLFFVEKLLIDKKWTNEWNLIITKDAIFNKTLHVKNFCPNTFENVVGEKSSILSKFSKMSARYPKTIFFVNVISSKWKNFNLNEKNKMETRVSSFVENTKYDFKTIETKNNLYQYMKLPLEKQANENEKFLSITNKTVVILNGNVEGCYKKRSLSEFDYPVYYPQYSPSRYFHAGTPGREQQKYKTLFEIFFLQICSDYFYPLMREKDSNLKNLFHIIQSDFLDETQTHLTDGCFIQIDAFVNNCHVILIDNKKKTEIQSTFTETFKSYQIGRAHV